MGEPYPVSLDTLVLDSDPFNAEQAGGVSHPCSDLTGDMPQLTLSDGGGLEP